MALGSFTSVSRLKTKYTLTHVKVCISQAIRQAAYFQDQRRHLHYYLLQELLQPAL